MMILISFLLTLAVMAVDVQDSATKDLSKQVSPIQIVESSLPQYSITIETISAPAGRYHDTLDIIFDSEGGSLAGFDLKIAVDNSYLEILKILPGEIPDSCSWQHFMARERRKSELSNLPSVMWQITGLAQTIPGGKGLTCQGFDRPASIARLVVSNAHIREMPDTTVPIFFIWEDCTDNVLSDASGSALIVSDTVLDNLPAYWQGSQAYKQDFPTKMGTPNSCINASRNNAPRRLLELHNGGVHFIYDWFQPDSVKTDSN